MRKGSGAAFVHTVVFRSDELPSRCASTIIGCPKDVMMSWNLAEFGTFSMKYVIGLACDLKMPIIRLTQHLKGSDSGESQPRMLPAIENG